MPGETGRENCVAGDLKHMQPEKNEKKEKKGKKIPESGRRESAETELNLKYVFQSLSLFFPPLSSLRSVSPLIAPNMLRGVSSSR